MQYICAWPSYMVYHRWYSHDVPSALPVLTKLPYSSMLFILDLNCTVHRTEKLKNGHLAKKHASSEQSGLFNILCQTPPLHRKKIIQHCQYFREIYQSCTILYIITSAITRMNIHKLHLSSTIVSLISLFMHVSFFFRWSALAEE